MAVTSVLVLSPSSEFRDSIRHSLTKKETFFIMQAASLGEMARSIEDYHTLDYALIDMDLDFSDAFDSVTIIRDKFPETEIVFISKYELPEEADELHPWKLLRKPFIESDLLDLFSGGGAKKRNQFIETKFREKEPSDIPAWAVNKNKIESILINNLSEMEVQEAILFSKNDIVASVGGLNEDEIASCTNLVYKYLDSTGHGEVIKQVRIENKNYLLHASIMAIGIILALLYSPETPYKMIRNQTRFLSDSIRGGNLPSGSSDPVSRVAMLKKIQDLDRVLVDDLVRDTLKQQLKRKLHPRPARKFRKSGGQNKVNKIDGGLTHAFQKPSEIEDEIEDEEGLEFGTNDVDEAWSQPTVKPSTQKTLRSHEEQEHAAHAENTPKSQPEEYKNKAVPAVTNFRNNDFQKASGRISCSSIGLGSNLIPCACLLIPRIKPLARSKDIVKFINDEIPTIFLAYGWRLEGLFTNRDFFQWIVSLPPKIPAIKHIEVIRKESSKLILSNFENLGRNGLIRDFWAPGYLFEYGLEKIPDQDIQLFIQTNRQNYYPRENFEQHIEPNYLSFT